MLDVLENWRVMAPRRVAAGLDLEDMSLLDSLVMLAMRVVCVVDQGQKVQIGRTLSSNVVGLRRKVPAPRLVNLASVILRWSRTARRDAYIWCSNTIFRNSVALSAPQSKDLQHGGRKPFREGSDCRSRGQSLCVQSCQRGTSRY
jgi:hypothetical protein